MPRSSIDSTRPIYIFIFRFVVYLFLDYFKDDEGGGENIEKDFSSGYFLKSPF